MVMQVTFKLDQTVVDSQPACSLLACCCQFINTAWLCVQSTELVILAHGAAEVVKASVSVTHLW